MIKYILKDKDDYNKSTYGFLGMAHSDEPRYFCVLCGHVTCIDNSFSMRGSKLTCTDCVEKYFNNDYDRFSLWLGSGSEFIGVREDENNTENNR